MLCLAQKCSEQSALGLRCAKEHWATIVKARMAASARNNRSCDSAPATKIRTRSQSPLMDRRSRQNHRRCQGRGGGPQLALEALGLGRIRIVSLPIGYLISLPTGYLID